MRKSSYKIFWNDEFVGEMMEPNSDMFFFYGKWKPVKASATDDFLNELKAGKQLVVKLDDPETGLTGIVEFFPDEEIEVKVYPNLS